MDTQLFEHWQKSKKCSSMFQDRAVSPFLRALAPFSRRKNSSQLASFLSSVDIRARESAHMWKKTCQLTHSAYTCVNGFIQKIITLKIARKRVMSSVFFFSSKLCFCSLYFSVNTKHRILSYITFNDIFIYTCYLKKRKINVPSKFIFWSVSTVDVDKGEVLKHIRYVFVFVCESVAMQSNEAKIKLLKTWLS